MNDQNLFKTSALLSSKTWLLCVLLLDATPIPYLFRHTKFGTHLDIKPIRCFPTIKRLRICQLLCFHLKHFFNTVGIVIFILELRVDEKETQVFWDDG